jgi:hypothetical protein
MFTGAFVQGRAARRPAHRFFPSVAALEWSEEGRNPHFVEGWWMIPSLAIGMAIWIGLIALIV